MIRRACTGILTGTILFMGLSIPAAETGPIAATWDAIAECKEFAAVPDKVNADQRPPAIAPSTGQTAAALAGGGASSAYSATKTGSQRSFQLRGSVPQVRTMHWQFPVTPRNIASMPYYVLRYKARHHRRDHHPLSVVSVVGSDAKGEIVTLPLLDSSEVINDGQWHLLIGRQDKAVVAKAIEVQVSTVGSDAALEIACLRFQGTFPRVPSAMAHGSAEAVVGGDFRPVAISGLFNDEFSIAIDRSLKAYGKVVDCGDDFAAASTSVGGVPFAVVASGRNIIVPPGNPNANTDTVEVLGSRLARTNYKRVAREDAVSIPLQGKASEVCFLMISEMAPTIGRYALPSIPLRLSNIDAFAVELVYATGESDWSFPYSLDDGGFSIQRFIAAYAVPADSERDLKAIVFHNRFYPGSFDVAAVTVNAGKAAVIPPEIRNPAAYRVVSRPRPTTRFAKCERVGDRCAIENGDYRMEIDCAAGFAINGLSHRWSPETRVALAGGGLEVQIGDQTLTGRDFHTEGLAIGEGVATFTLTSKVASVPLTVTIAISGDASSQLKFNADLRNTGRKPIDASIRFPVLKGLAIGNAADTWMYFPQCRNVCTNGTGTYLAANDRPFPLQFFDVFNPTLGVGIAFLTHNLTQDVLDYAVRKDASGVEAFIQHAPGYHVILPGQSITLTSTSLVFHEGDWHAALAAYQDWVKTWYRPLKADGLDWWQKSFTLRSHVTAQSYSWAVPIFDAKTNQYRVDAMLKEDRGYLGLVPDVIHLGGWVDYRNLHAGDFNGGDYAVKDYTGGPDALRAAVKQMQGQGVRASLYTIPDRCAKTSEIGQKLGRAIAQTGLDGSLSQDEKCWYVCIGAKPWMDHYVAALKRSQRETGANAIYVDVFPYTRGYACYSKEHGHEVPLNVNRMCSQLARRLREELPQEVALWSEFLSSDVNSQYISGNITYYFLTLHEYLVTSYDQAEQSPRLTPVAQSVHRFAFPHSKQWGFPVGFEGGPNSQDLRFLFFNGEGLYDVGWLLYDSRDLQRVQNWLAIQRQYSDCFASLAPVPLVPTAAGGVYANEFPGDGRTAWTVFNARYTTYRGPVLMVDHRTGDVYHDAWNRKPLAPHIEGGKAILSLSLEPQGLGCIVRIRKRDS
jgi:hypothetical protein